jgi:putative flippase GtrA
MYSALVFCGVYYLIASAAAFIVSVLNSFFWNNKYVFKEHKEKRRIAPALFRTFAAYGSTGLILNNILLFVLVDTIKISEYIAPLLCLIVTIPLNFILNKFWAFNNS